MCISIADNKTKAQIITPVVPYQDSVGHMFAVKILCFKTTQFVTVAALTGLSLHVPGLKL